MMWWGHGWGWGDGAWFGFAMMHVLFWVFLIGGIVMVARWGSGRGPRSGPLSEKDHALDILRERFARGEIDKQEFEERRQVLKGP